jgi:predicted outer membrane repeat protein
MNLDFSKLINNVAKVKLGGGIFGKTCTVIIVIAVTFGGIAWIANNLWVCILALFLIAIIAFVLLWRLIDFADKNPQAVILEGAEFLVHQQIELAAKGIPNLPKPVNIIPASPINITQFLKEQSNQPDIQISTNEKEEKNG